jgi:hypothetical protein
MAHMDGFPRKSDFLSEKSMKEWVKPTQASNETYGLGWSVNIMGFNGWQHDGRMPGLFLKENLLNTVSRIGRYACSTR